MDGMASPKLPSHYLQILQEERAKANFTTSYSLSDKHSPDTSVKDTSTTVEEQFSRLTISSGEQLRQDHPNASEPKLQLGSAEEFEKSSTSVIDESFPHQDKPRSVFDYYCTTDTPNTTTFDYVLEVYGFHPSLKTKDLLKELHTYGSLKVRLKWVDDTHALAIYTNTKDALIASKGAYSSIKVQLLSKSNHADSWSTAEKCAESMKDSLSVEVGLRCKPQRPQTTSTVARRMVGHALGIKINVTPEQSHQEKLKIDNAKEEKRRKQQT